MLCPSPAKTYWHSLWASPLLLEGTFSEDALRPAGCSHVTVCPPGREQTPTVGKRWCRKSTCVPQRCIAHTSMPKASFTGCPSQEVWPTTSALSLGRFSVWVWYIPRRFSPLRGLESLCPVFLYFFDSVPCQHLSCKWLVFADWFFLSILKELLALWKTSAQNRRTSDKMHY